MLRRIVLVALLVLAPAGPGAAADPPLVAAAKHGDAAAVAEMIAAGAALEATDWAGWTALAWAALGHHDAVIRLLVDAGADVDAVARAGKNSGTPLMLAARRRNAAATLRLLLAAGAAVDGVDQYGRTALMMAAREGLLGNMRLLIAAGADVNTRARLAHGNTALALARRGGHDRAAALLRAAGAQE